MRRQSNTPSFKRAVLNAHGRFCVNCGSAEGVELHHIVPLSMGGTNNIQNIVPLCCVCHTAVHKSKEAWREAQRHGKYDRGRKRKVPDGYEQVLDDYLHCRIAMSEVREKFGWTMPTQKLNDRVWFKEYLEQHGVVKYRNNIDCLLVNGELEPGRPCGYLETDDGVREEFAIGEDFYMTHTTPEKRREHVKIKLFSMDMLPSIRCPVCGQDHISVVGETVYKENLPGRPHPVERKEVLCENCQMLLGKVVV